MEITPAPRIRRSRRSACARLLGRTFLVAAVLGGGLWTATHGVAHVGWGEVAAILRGVSAEQLLVLTTIWLGGLAVYCLVLCAALPGLGVSRSLLLNLSGSAVANVVPLGGAVGTALNWRMVTRWGHSNHAFAAYCLLTNALDALTKLVLPLVAVAGLVLVSAQVPTTVWAMAACCAVALLAAALLVPALRRLSPGTSSRVVVLGRLRQQTVECWSQVRGLLRAGAPRLLLASAGYIATQVALLDVSLRAVGLQAPVTVVLMAAAIERLGTLVPITPGGAGVAEVGAIAWLVGSGLSPVQAVAGVLLCRVFLVVMEIPLGGAMLAGWLWCQRGTRSRAGAAA